MDGGGVGMSDRAGAGEFEDGGNELQHYLVQRRSSSDAASVAPSTSSSSLTAVPRFVAKRVANAVLLGSYSLNLGLRVTGLSSAVRRVPQRGRPRLCACV